MQNVHRGRNPQESLGKDDGSGKVARSPSSTQSSPVSGIFNMPWRGYSFHRTTGNRINARSQRRQTFLQTETSLYRFNRFYQQPEYKIDRPPAWLPEEVRATWTWQLVFCQTFRCITIFHNRGRICQMGRPLVERA